MSAGARILKWQRFRAYPHPPAAPVTVNIYADPGTGLTTVDGQIDRTPVSEDWPTIHGSTGLVAYPSRTLMLVGIGSDQVGAKWHGIARIITTHDLAVIPTDKTILSARYCWYGQAKTDQFGYKPQVALYQSYPLADNDLVPDDYPRLYNTVLSNVVDYDDFVVGGFNYFDFNAAGLALLVPGQIVRLGLREAKFDAPNIEPGWVWWKGMYFQGRSVDYANVQYRPYLEVTYQ